MQKLTTLFPPKKLCVIMGPCVIESRDDALFAAEYLSKIFSKRKNIRFFFKASYDKANRSSIHSYRGTGLKEGLEIFTEIKRRLGLDIFTDVHSPEEAQEAGKICDVIQIPAFLCRQTDLLVASGKSGACVNIKKGQFMAPWDMVHAVEKVRSTGNQCITLTERGTSFGYNNLVSDMRSIPILKKLGLPILYDATHSVQLPGGAGATSSGQREFILTLSKAALAAGCDAIYAEAHQNPEKAKSDGPNMIPFDQLELYLDHWERIYAAANF